MNIKNEIDRELLAQAIDYIDTFIENIECGDSYWIDPAGKQYTADIGYGYQFWKQISEYLKKN